MDDYMDVLESTESETILDEQPDYTMTVSGNMASASGNDPESDLRFDELMDVLSNTQNFGTIGDYYNQYVGCYVFPNFDVYEYFIDIDAVGHEWVEASDGHYLPLAYLEAYEGYRSGEGDEEEQEFPADAFTGDTETLETLESVRGLLSVIKENNTAYYEAVLDYQTEMLEIEQKSLAMAEGTMYAGITGCVLLGVVAGSFISHVFFGRMRNG